MSFVARQRDLRKLIGDTVPGAQKLNFDDSVDWSEGRFGVIKLEDRNLPMIANKRVLKPKSDAAQQELDAAFEETAKIRKEVMDTLLTDEYGREMFRLIYPFSPALMETLIAASSMLQRERTALKVMMQLLVEQQETLKVGDIVPVGDLYDAVAHGDEAFSQDMKVHFDNARKLYHEKLLPMLEAQHGARREELLAKPFDDQGRINFVNDDRLVKTLLLGGAGARRQLAAGAERQSPGGAQPRHDPLADSRQGGGAGAPEGARTGRARSARSRSATIRRTRRSPSSSAAWTPRRSSRPPSTRTTWATRCGWCGRSCSRNWRSRTSIRCSCRMSSSWRNTTRECDVIYGNVRSLPETSLTANAPTWKVIIDYPFDEPGHTTRDDQGKLQIYSQNNPSGTRTLVWLPAFFSETARRDLSRLVIIEHILAGERFNGYAAFLSPQDRQHRANAAGEPAQFAARAGEAAHRGGLRHPWEPEQGNR